MLTVTTRDASVFTIGYRQYGDSGHRLFVRLAHPTADPYGGGCDELTVDQWYLLNVLNPTPPQIGRGMALVLHIKDRDEPVVHRTTTVMSVVGTL